MIVHFPELKPSNRTVTQGVYPTKQFKTVSGVSSFRRYGTQPVGASLDLEFSAISDAEAELIAAAFDEAYGNVHILALPEILWSDIELPLRDYLSHYYAWRFADTPVFSRASIPGFKNVSVRLEGTRDSEQLPVVSVSALDPIASETDLSNTGIFRLSRTGNILTGIIVSVTYSGTATNGSDYITLPSTIAIPEDQIHVNIPVSAIVDLNTESVETVTMTISPHSSYLIANNSATISLLGETPATEIDVDLAVLASDANYTPPDRRHIEWESKITIHPNRYTIVLATEPTLTSEGTYNTNIAWDALGPNGSINPSTFTSNRGFAVPVTPRISSIITDSSQYNHTPYIFNNGPITSTAQSVFGGSAGFFNGIAAFYQYNNITTLQLPGDCTLESLVFPLSTNDMNLGFSSMSDTIDIFRINEGAPGNISFRISPTQVIGPVAAGITPNSWYHLRYTRTNGQGRLFVNGEQKGPTNPNMQGTFYWNQLGAGYNAEGWYRQFYGFYDEVRITKNVSRSISNFTPQSSPFANYKGSYALGGDPHFDNVVLLLHLDSAAAVPKWASVIEESTTLKINQIKSLRLLVDDPSKVNTDLSEFIQLCRNQKIKLYNNRNGYLEMQPNQNWISMFTARDLPTLT